MDQEIGGMHQKLDDFTNRLEKYIKEQEEPQVGLQDDFLPEKTKEDFQIRFDLDSKVEKIQRDLQGYQKELKRQRKVEQEEEDEFQEVKIEQRFFLDNQVTKKSFKKDKTKNIKELLMEEEKVFQKQKKVYLEEILKNDQKIEKLQEKLNLIQKPKKMTKSDKIFQENKKLLRALKNA